ncbi:hypothetical protein PYCCODRAFT_1422842 [Trametes coccinea BRFM310]|uniref:Uncharacterized protein n=1 Tax=Trametes coccinea (strain BRFM310) TaxID=1353009 RepID=A0A1Y2J2G6_TRAC3|nr:hypothetical protein PYCCODRAFT_1422842 [Trametes coccinea BRFM310]
MAAKKIQTNDALFPIFEKYLAGDNLQEFTTASEKLAAWLSRDKAYYPKARPTTAHETVRRHSEYPHLPFHVSRITESVKPWAESFVKVVRTVAPFYTLFSEPTQQQRLRVLVQTLCDNVDVFLSQQPSPIARPSVETTPNSTPGLSQLPSPAQYSQLSPATTMQSTPVQTPTASVPPPSVLTTHPGLTGAHTQTGGLRPSPVSAVTTALQNQPAPPPLPGSGSKFPSITIPHAPAQVQRTLSTPVLPPKRPLQHEPVRTASADQTSPSAPPSAAVSSEQPARPKAKKRKTVTVDFDFIEADLDWYQHTRASDAVASPRNSTSAGPTAEVPAPSASAKQEPGVSSTSEMPDAGHPAASGTPAPAVPAASVTATLPREESRAESKSRSPSVPLRDIATSPPVVTKNDKPVDANSSTKSLGDGESPPRSPAILGPSLTRRPSQSSPADASPLAAATPADAPPQAPSPPVLPSPLLTKKPKTKKKKGPPGLKFLPILTPSGVGMVESPAVEEPLDEGVASTEAAEELVTFGPAPLLASQPPSPPGSHKDSPREEQPSASSGLSRRRTPLFFDSPAPMDVDESKPVLTVDTVAVEEPRASGDVTMHDSTTIAAISGAHDEHAAAAVQQPPPMALSQPPPHPVEVPSSEVASASEPVPADINGLPLSAVATASMEPIARQDHGRTPAASSRKVSPEPLMAAIADTVDAPSVPVTEPTSVSLCSDGVTLAPTAAVAPVSTPVAKVMSVDPPSSAVDDAAELLLPFAETAARVLCIARGAPSITPASQPVLLDFELTAEELTQIARWNTRGKNIDDLSNSLCLSFVSFLISQCVGSATDDPEGIADVTQCGRPSVWPRDSSFIVLNDGEGANSLVIAPPFVTTPDKCVDLSSRALREGRNTIKLYQYSDHSDRVFVVLLHHPTRAQLAELDASRAEDRKWREALADLWKFEVRVPRIFPPSTVTNGIVGRI